MLLRPRNITGISPEYQLACLQRAGKNVTNKKVEWKNAIFYLRQVLSGVLDRAKDQFGEGICDIFNREQRISEKRR